MKKFVRVELEVHNEVEYDEQIKAKRIDAVYGPLIRLLAQAADEAATGSNTWVSVGKTQDGTSLALSVHSPDGRLSCYAGTLAGLALECDKLL